VSLSPGSSTGCGAWKRVASRVIRAHGEYLLSGAGGVQIGITLESDGRTGGRFTVVVDSPSLGVASHLGSVTF